MAGRAGAEVREGIVVEIIQSSKRDLIAIERRRQRVTHWKWIVPRRRRNADLYEVSVRYDHDAEAGVERAGIEHAHGYGQAFRSRRLETFVDQPEPTLRNE